MKLSLLSDDVIVDGGSTRSGERSGDWNEDRNQCETIKQKCEDTPRDGRARRFERERERERDPTLEPSMHLSPMPCHQSPPPLSVKTRPFLQIDIFNDFLSISANRLMCLRESTNVLLSTPRIISAISQTETENDWRFSV